MNHSVYIYTPDANSGKSLISFGVIQMVMRNTTNIAYYKPIIEEKSKKDNEIETIISHFNLNMNYEDAYSFTRNEVLAYKNTGRTNELYDTFVRHYKMLEEKYDFVLIEGMDNFEEKTHFEASLNGYLAKSFNIPVLMVFRDNHDTLDDLANHVAVENAALRENEIKVIGNFINKTTKNVEEVKKAVAEKLPPDMLVNVFPRKNELAKPTLREIAEATKASFLIEGNSLEVIARHSVAGAMQLHNFLTRVEEDCVVILPGDRSDIIVGALLANMSSTYPHVAGFVLTGGLLPEKSILDILHGFENSVPILTVKTGTFETITKVDAIKPKLYPQNTVKIKMYLDLFDEYVDGEELQTKIASFKSDAITPKMFQYQMFIAAKKAQKHIVLPEGGDNRVLTAASMLAQDEMVKLTVLGNPEDIRDKIKKLKLPWNEARISIVNPADSDKYNEYAQTLYELRKSKGMDETQAKDLMLDVSYFGTMMVYKGDADGMVSGAMHTTAHTIRPSLQFVKTKPGVNTVSSVFFMLLDDRVLVYGDCAIVPNPTAEQLAEIAISSADSAKAFGIEPKVALLSYSSGASGSGEDVDKVRAATAIVKEKRPDLLVEGPIQYDAAVDPSVGKSKMPDSPVAGQANVLIFPDLNTGNNTYKAVQRESGGLAIGPVLQGLRKPVNDLSRGATIPDIYNTVIITAIQAASN
ncbi:phosphate acetyltransferase [Haoranjiania flava]|uniref:Phosphate acetyltransferase n=1 Tax=Haoranjiania flava TaxID=1856322 RepID=A0AAE3IPK8_9BACT|nr:phosphate acetyltransferase [Haoranjiania flava]MCU7693482.1 phosphate acetyltransferase [Haoranjiania flava]